MTSVEPYVIDRLSAEDVKEELDCSGGGLVQGLMCFRLVRRHHHMSLQARELRCMYAQVWILFRDKGGGSGRVVGRGGKLGPWRNKLERFC